MAVTLGGGITMTYGSCGESARGVNTPRSSHRWYSRRSTSCGLYWGGNANRGSGIPYYRQGAKRRGRARNGGRSRHSAPFRAFPRSLEYRSEEHTSELQSLTNLVCRLLLEKKKTK